MNQLKPKVLFILHLPPPVHGAAVVGQLIKNSVLINSQMEATYLNLSTSVTVDDIGKGGLKKGFRFVSLFFIVFAKTIRLRPKLVYITMTSKGVGFYKDAVIVLLLKLLGRKVVFHFHNKGITDNQHKRLDNMLYRAVFRNANVILLSEKLKADVAKYVKDEQIHYCPNGWKLVQDEAPRLERNSPVISLLFIGNLAESKGVFDLLKALKILNDKGVRFKCNIIGGEGSVSSKELMEGITEMNLEANVNYLGKVFGEEKEKYLRTSDILIHPPHEECFGLVILEAMNYALPVVATIEGGIPDIVQHEETGFLVEKCNVTELAGRIHELIADAGLRERLGTNGRKRFVENFTLEIFENKFSDIIKNLTR